ncbi:Ca[2+] channel Muscle-specific alpha2/delta subunit [Carabus blaptoides fortunei]
MRAEEIVDGWANLLGSELWDLAQNVTNSAKIKENYTNSNAQVEKKEPEKLLSAIVENITKMLKTKMDAVRCILQAAEETADAYVYNETDQEFLYYSSKYSMTVNYEDGKNFTPEIPKSLENNAYMYLNMTLTNDTHFHNIEVDTSHSSVHVPTNVFDKSKAAQTAIEWSEHLDDVFIQNYNSDPALSWQYFCSSSGVMRHYPAMHWHQETDLFDCRIRSWFIEAATCSKNVIILMDNSGSMDGMWHHIAKFTISKILDTFSNNDFINIYRYNDTAEPIEPCFNNTLVQATLENIDIFKSRLDETQSMGYANLGVAMTRAFKILNESRQRNDCGDEGTGCNQAIMLLTDGVPNNVTEVFEEYNWLNNGSNIPVRIFTYLIGREVSYVEEISWMACLNRGYFVHVRSLDEAMEKVLKYIHVIARPLVLQAEEHPVSWTHAFITDNTFEAKREGFENYRLFTSVAVPAYDRKLNRNNETRMAELLGVAATDVPIEDIEKLTIPYKIGVNGYVFIVTNNGYLLMHPNLRPLYEGRLNLNYNSMDFSEVEFLDDDFGPRQINERILELREALVNHSEGSILGLPVKHFYDNMKRLYKESYDYYYAPLHGTPFSVGMALPQSHGNYWLKVEDEIGKNQHLKIDIVKKYLRGNNWRIHPKWVYCKYHYTEGHEFATPEDELVHFLKVITKERNFTWPPNQYGEFDFTLEDVADEEVECGRQTWEDDDYYCDKDLVQRLVFDAKVMEEAFMIMDLNYNLLDIYGVTLKYVATMSGLTKWEYIYGEGNDTVRDFGDVHSRAIDETWYRSAVLQHQIDPDSFVYSVPFKKDPNVKELMMSASHAIFPRDAGHEAPGCVVGFQFQHSKFFDRFLETIDMNMTNCDDCNTDWNKDMVDSFVIDNHGYIVLSKDRKHIGKFFGEIEGSVMEAMLINDTFETVTVYDLQAVCVYQRTVSSSSNILLTPFHFIGWVIHWIFTKSMYIFFETNLHQLLSSSWVLATPFDDYDDVLVTTEKSVTTAAPRKKLRKGQKIEEEEYFKALREKKPEIVNISEPCDLKANLYLLNQTKFINRNEYSGEEKSQCSKPFYAKRIPHSNLLFVVVLASTQSCDSKLSASKQTIIYSGDIQPPCHKLELNRLHRRKLLGCFNEHPLESEINISILSKQDFIKRLNNVDINSLILVTYVKFAKIQCNVTYGRNPLFKNMPRLYIEENNTSRELVGFAEIWAYLKEQIFDIDQFMTEKQRSDSYAYCKYMGNSLLPGIYCTLWVDMQNYIDVTRKWFRSALLFPINFWYPYSKSNEITAIVKILTPDENIEDYSYILTDEAKKCINDLATKLGNKNYFFGNSTSSFDAVVYGYLAPLLYVPVPVSPLQAYLKEQDNLVKFVKRVTNSFFPQQKLEYKHVDSLQREDDLQDNKTPTGTIAAAAFFAATAMLTYGIINGIIRIPLKDA